jgi:uncharacterized phage protein (TIGR01671 family)
MRELKFRVWSKARKEWVHNMMLLACIDGLPFAHFVEVNEIDKSVKHHVYNASNLDVEIQQYTGLKDKNGKEIYEGDIVEWGMSHDQINPFPKLRYVEFCERQLIYKVVEVGDLPSSLDYLYEAAPMSTRWCRVVGSIHENPELLEQ